MIYLSPDLAGQTTNDGNKSSYHIFVNQQIITILNDKTLRSTLNVLAANGIEWRTKAESDQHAIERLRSSIDVHPVPDSYELSVQVVSSSAKLAADIANSVAQAYLGGDGKSGESGGGEDAAVLNAEKAALESQLQAALNIRGSLAATLGLINPGEASSMPQDEVLRRTRESIAAAHNKRIELEARLDKNVTGPDADDWSSPSHTALLQRRADLKERIKDMLPSHPVRKQIEAELADIDSQLQGTSETGSDGAGSTKDKLRAQAEAERQVEAQLTKDLADQTSSIPSSAKNMEQMRLVIAETKRLQDRLNQVEAHLDNIKINKLSGAIAIFAPALPPDKPMKSQKTKVLIAVWFGAILLGLAVPIALDLTDNRVYKASEVQKLLDFPFLGLTISPDAKVDAFAAEQLARVAAGLSRTLVTEPEVRTVVVMQLKKSLSNHFLSDLTEKLFQYGIYAGSSPKFDLKPQSYIRDRHAESAQREIELIGGPALLFTAEAERLASQAGLLLVVIEAGFDTRADLEHCARVLQRLNIAKTRIVLSNVLVPYAERALQREVREFLALR